MSLSATSSVELGDTPVEPVEVILGKPVTDTVTATATVAADVKEITANSIIKNHIIASIGTGLVPIPLVDISALTAIQTNLLRQLSKHYGVPVHEWKLKPLLWSLVGGVTPVMAVASLSSIAKVMPGIGTLAGSASLGLLAGAITYAVGQTFMLHFEAGGTLENFDPKVAQAFFQRELTVGKRFVQSIRDEIKRPKPVDPPSIAS